MGKCDLKKQVRLVTLAIGISDRLGWKASRLYSEEAIWIRSLVWC
jgi:hypothetical protein